MNGRDNRSEGGRMLSLARLRSLFGELGKTQDLTLCSPGNGGLFAFLCGLSRSEVVWKAPKQVTRWRSVSLRFGINLIGEDAQIPPTEHYCTKSFPGPRQ